MSKFNLKIKRKYQSGGINPPVTISTKTNEYIIENGKEVEISLSQGENTINFACTTKLNGNYITRTKEACFSLKEDSTLEFSCFNGIISIDKLPVYTPKTNIVKKSPAPKKPANEKRNLSIIISTVLTIISAVCAFFFKWALLVCIPSTCVLVYNIVQKINKKRITMFYHNEGKKDIEVLEALAVENNVTVTPNSEDVVSYVEKLLNELLYLHKSKLVRTLNEAGYYKSLEIDNLGTIYYDSSNALIFIDVFFSSFSASVNAGFSYMHVDRNGNKKYWDLREVLSFFKTLESPESYSTLAKKIFLKELFWYVEYPSSAGHSLADTAAGAVIGGLILGPVGALAGAMSTNNSHKKDEKEKISVVLGQKGGSCWCIAEGEYNTQRAIEKLSEHFPQNRSSDRYRKTL